MRRLTWAELSDGPALKTDGYRAAALPDIELAFRKYPLEWPFASRELYIRQMATQGRIFRPLQARRRGSGIRQESTDRCPDVAVVRVQHQPIPTCDHMQGVRFGLIPVQYLVNPQGEGHGVDDVDLKGVGLCAAHAPGDYAGSPKPRFSRDMTSDGGTRRFPCGRTQCRGV